MFLSCISRSTAPSALAVVFARGATLRCSAASFSSVADDNTDTDRNSDHDLQSKTSVRVDEYQTQAPQSGGIPLQQRQQTRRRTRGRTLKSSLDKDNSKPIPSLADFMHRAKVMKQYRNFVRVAKFVDGTDRSNNNTSGECRAALEEVKLSYKLGMKKDIDALSKNMAYSEGERRLRELEAAVGYSANKEQSYDADSWINIQDEEDPRGRVGVQWPWQRDDDESK
eukprot:CAMPEP_0201994706 /NCGR_PEP_ID=MMETSP0905-20130828/2453_1 /ASSEMBLY_ACC=CAM_ASM_000554 /TAXON_ID=420261 /ORGANISM="Thalassiosira antarctica, Strain CCMP982" /LENGTH=224 /DNA_ID=CAMNT_0048549727 /DNA_START=9 /DNA_END=683 /DNA_ORIENTATION=+